MKLKLERALVCFISSFLMVTGWKQPSRRRKYTI